MPALQHADTANFRKNIASACRSGSIQAVADKAEITRVHLSRIIHGHATPSIDVAARLAQAVDIPLAGLLVEPENFSEKVAQ
jgi:transcriptional regulator with XRE-family HTH domain